MFRLTLFLATVCTASAAAQDHQHMPGMAPPAVPRPAQPAPHAGHDMGSTPAAMPAAFGPYGMQREASGTSWQPDASDMMGAMTSVGGWHLMGHAQLNGVYDHQSGPRGRDKGLPVAWSWAWRSGRSATATRCNCARCCRPIR